MAETPPQSIPPTATVRPIKGVFSVEASQFLGRVLSSRAIGQRIFVFAEERTSGRVRLQRLDPDFKPSGPVRFIDRERLLADYQPEPGIYINKVGPAMQYPEASPVLADKYRLRRGVAADAFAAQPLAHIDEEHVRATFGLGLTYLERREKEKADIIFQKLMQIESAFTLEHKHLFNDFGIQMRKLGMYDEAMRYYMRAYRLCKTDEHLLYNMARTLYAKGRLASARAMLRNALRLRADFPEAQTFLTFLDAKLRGDTPPEPILD